MKQLLIPSRHIIYSKEQYALLRDHLSVHHYDCLVFIVTSSNLNNCKYSPVALHHRIMMVDNLIFQLQKEFTFTYKIVCLPHYHQIESFVERVIKTINLELDISISRETSEVFALGSYIGELFSKAGYETFVRTGIDHIKLFKELFENNNKEYFYNEISTASLTVLDNQTEILKHAKKIWLDTILKEKGSITESRNYNTYTIDMSNTAMIEVKYNDIKKYIVEGKITDEGCADAALFAPIARDFPDSDLLGVDISNDFIARANENIRRGLFGGSFVSIIQANLMEPLFEESTINTTICNSTMHEVWSYNNKQESVDAYLSLKYNQLKEGGRVLIRDVIGPKNKNSIVYIRSLEDNNEHFKKFVQDFKHVRNEDFIEEIYHDGKLYHKTTYKLAGEYLLHKDYRDNWDSEVFEEFCYFDVDDWRNILLSHQFKIVTIESYQSSWILENRYKGKLELLDESMNIISFPDTNVIVVAEK